MRSRHGIGALSFTPRPFVKWAGGKGQLLEQILPLLPQQIDTYYEPFIGGGAVFFELARLGRVRRAVLGDFNGELINVYQEVRDAPDAVCDRAESWTPSEEEFYRVRALDPATLDPLTCAARTLWLNRTCFNGLYRVNSKGIFNVPYGRYAFKRGFSLDRANLRACSRALAAVELRVGDFEETLRDVPPGAVVYLDPPYLEVKTPKNDGTTNRSFTAYSGRFLLGEHSRLALRQRALAEAGAYAVLSNADAPVAAELYEGLEVHKVLATRRINRDGEGREAVSELLVIAGRRPAR